ncbi:MaoC/PaaZ C-terminal domain-containing protein [Rhodococcoides kyotonense]|uniref:MaoC/PaaZ C-terminal domain-containing protein n=1 Tax=Rhodococcoides kyotonense TaxID=398843 RepID=UPI001595683C|nr:MaoC/PaaZ C-terminal domain-containing protein [Rhodococcus kyotonensis]
MTDTWVHGCDLGVGDRFELSTYEVRESEIIEFAFQWDPLGLHTDASAAAHGRFGGIIASGVQTLGVFQRLAVIGHWRSWRIIAGRGIKDLRFEGPVHPADTLSGWFVISGVESVSRSVDVVTIAGTLSNQYGATVLTLTMELQLEHGLY